MIEIIIPAYNCSDTINRTMASLVGQTSRYFSVLVVDDCSTQDIASIVERYKDRLSIRYIRNHENRGCGLSRQRGIDETKEEYITFLDSDDVLLPNAVEVWTAEIERAKPDVIYSPFIYKDGEKISIKSHGFFMCHGKVYNTDFLRKYDIGESKKVKCHDDSYLNWQTFDLASTVSLLKEPTYLQINTAGSITNTNGFKFKAIVDYSLAEHFAIQQISRFKENPLSNYQAIERQINAMLRNEAENHQKIIEEVSRYNL